MDGDRTITLAEYTKHFLMPAYEAHAAQFEAENPELMKRLRRNSRRRELYAQRQLLKDTPK